MKINVVGYKLVEYTKDGRDIKGASVYYTNEDLSNQKLVGIATGDLWINAKLSETIDFKSLLQSGRCEVVYNQYGKPEEIYPLTE